MKLLIAALVAGAMFSGCAARVVSAGPRTVVVDAGRPPQGKAGEAQALAEAQCAKHQRHARMVARPIYGESTEYVFDCVE